MTPPTKAQYTFSILVRIVALFAAGVAYGTVVTRLHESRSIVPVELQLEVVVDRTSWLYLGFWGLAGVVLGSLLPTIDRALAADVDEADTVLFDEKESNQTPAEAVDGQEARVTYLGAEWNPLVRGVGAFVGIAFAIVRSPHCCSHLWKCNTDTHRLAPPPVAIHTASLSHPCAC